VCWTIRDLGTPTHTGKTGPRGPPQARFSVVIQIHPRCSRACACEQMSLMPENTVPLYWQHYFLLLSGHLGLLLLMRGAVTTARCVPRRPTLQASKQASKQAMQEDCRQLSLSRETEAKQRLARSELICERLWAGRF
jgi:hypothetical protein